MRLGSEVPRIFTPPLRELTPETSLGFEVIEFATVILGLTLYPWQKWLLIHALELRADGRLRFRNVVVLVARQNGKSTLSQVLAAWWLFVCGVRLVLGTAQDLDTAEEVWDGVVDLATATDENDEPLRPDLAELVRAVVRVNGKKSLDLLTGERYKVKASTRRAGRGLSGDRIILDELREHQSWEAWGAITKTSMARPDAQIWCLSNAGDVTSVVLRHLRKMAHGPLGDPDGIIAADLVSELPDEAELEEISLHLDDTFDTDDFDVDEDDLGIFEWSAPPHCDVRDRDAWAQANPSMGHGLVAESTIASAARTDPEWVFRTEVLCQWPEGRLDGIFPAGAWEACAVTRRADGKLAPADRIDLSGRLSWGLQLSWDRKRAFVLIAGERLSDGVPQIEVAAKRVGTDWVVPWFSDPDHPERKTRPVAIQPGSPAWSLADALIAAGVEVVEWKGPDVATGTGWFYDEVAEAVHDVPGLRHTNDPALNLAVRGAAKKVNGGAWVIDQAKSTHDAAPLVAGVAAAWLYHRPEPAPAAPPPAPPTLASPSTAPTNDLVTASF
ncbi:hypothetical protein ACOCHS_06325 [Propionibacteriaceae bacterium Y2011]